MKLIYIFEINIGDIKMDKKISDYSILECMCGFSKNDEPIPEKIQIEIRIILFCIVIVTFLCGMILITEL